MLLLCKMMIDTIRDRAGRIRDEDGAIQTVEILIIVGVVILLAGAVFVIVRQKAEAEANSLDLG